MSSRRGPSSSRVSSSRGRVGCVFSDREMVNRIPGIGLYVLACPVCLQDVFGFELAQEDMTKIDKLGDRKLRMCNWKYRPGGGRIYEGETSAYPEK